MHEKIKWNGINGRLVGELGTFHTCAWNGSSHRDVETDRLKERKAAPAGHSNTDGTKIYVHDSEVVSNSFQETVNIWSETQEVCFRIEE